jgi:Ser/Thr protein kinase RdoA (MazF antagonist)
VTDVLNNIEWLSQAMMLDLYGLPLRSAELVNRGVNVTFRLWAGPGEFYLRLYRHQGRSRAQIDGEIAALLAFRSNYEVYVAKPQRLRDGGYVFTCTYNGEMRFACLFAAARGRPADANAGDMRQFGVALAVMHLQTTVPPVSCGRPFLPAAMLGEALKDLSKAGPKCRHICERIEPVRTAIVANLGRQSSLSIGFCHGDAWCGNVHFFGPRTTFFDFDDCFDGPLIADLVPQIAWLWHANRLEFPALVRVLLDAYTSLLPLTDADLAIIPPLVQLHEICAIAFIARYCSLEPAMWDECLERSRRILDDWSPGGAATAPIAPLTGVARMVRSRVA